QRNKHHEPVIPSHKHDVKPTPTAPKVLLGQPPSIYHCPPIC
ncbi:7173_t:CDS:2, partial [Gigaspora rosea]